MSALLRARNKAFYDRVWRNSKVRKPAWFPTWGTVETVVAGRGRLLEIGPGLRPRFPLEGTTFVELSAEAARKLRGRGARVVIGDGSMLPLADGCIDAACAIDVVEHVEEPSRAIAEIGRVLRPGGVLLLAVPLHGKLWTRFDDVVGHGRRLETYDVETVLHEADLSLERSAPFGFLPRSRALVRIGAWILARYVAPAAWLEDRFFLPLARTFQGPPRWAPGLGACESIGGVILFCRKRL